MRVWVPGCSTGEEAYSIAMLLHEQMATLKMSFPAQVFATDIDNRAIATARAGSYPVSIAGDLSPERLSRFFLLESDGMHYRVQKAIRDVLIFSEQDVIKDPPFSRLDLISCRNLMIYMGADLQRKLIPLFHYSLNPNGLLFLKGLPRASASSPIRSRRWIASRSSSCGAMPCSRRAGMAGVVPFQC